MVVRPGGPSIIAGILASQLVLYGFFQINEILALIITTFAAFVIGFVDDRKVMGGWFKTCNCPCNSCNTNSCVWRI